MHHQSGRIAPYLILSHFQTRPLTIVLLLTLCLFFNLFWAQPALAEIIYVNASATGANDGTSWTNAYTSLQDGLHKTVTISSALSRATVAADTFKLVVIPAAAPPGLELNGVDGSAPYTGVHSVVAKTNELLIAGCAGGSICNTIERVTVSADGSQDTRIIEELQTVTDIFLPFIGQ